MLDLSLRSMAGKKAKAACGTEVERALEGLERLSDPRRATRSGMRARFSQRATRQSCEKDRAPKMLEASNLSHELRSGA